MKYLIIPLASIIILLVAIACKKDENKETETTLSPEEKSVFLDLQSAYQSANNYNDSLIFCHNTANHCPDVFKYHCDSFYHHYDSLFEHYHDSYDHTIEHCDHYHDGYGTHHRGNHHHHNYSEGHHEHDHELMDELRQQHQYYHP